MLHDLHSKFIEVKDQHYLVVEGDSKVYDILYSLKTEYGDALQWLIPYPGDWYALWNYQIPLMKAYFDAGLAQVLGYPLPQLQTKRVHNCILQVWEGLWYRAMHAVIVNATG